MAKIFSNNSIILQANDGTIILYQILLKKGVLAEVSSLTLLGKYMSEDCIDEAALVNAKDVTGFLLSDCFLNNPS